MELLQVKGKRLNRAVRRHFASAARTQAGSDVIPYGPTNPHGIALAYLRKHGTNDVNVYIIRHWRGRFWKFAGDRYVPVDDDDMNKALTEFARRHFVILNAVNSRGELRSVTTTLVKNVEQALASQVHVGNRDEQPKWLSERDHGPHIAFANGLVSVKALQDGTPTVRAHSPDWFSTVCFRYEFNAPAVCHAWLCFLNEVFEGDQERIALLQEFMGLCLVFDMQFQRFLVLIGAPGAGKSVIAEVWTALVGSDHVSNVPLERFGERFALHGTLGRLVNFAHEPGPLTPAAENTLKAVTGQDRLTVEPKFKDAFEAYLTIRVVILTNNLPNFTDRSGGIWRRALFLPFNISVPVERQDRGLATRLKSELPGIFNWAWQGYMRLTKQRDFTLPVVSRQAAEEFLKDVNPSRDFLESHCVIDANGHVTGQQLYAHYRAWAEERGHKVLDERQFGKEVFRAFPDAKKLKKGPRDKRLPVYAGLRFDTAE
jgi:P4 family phage/plasmid primase-like protien